MSNNIKFLAIQRRRQSILTERIKEDCEDNFHAGASRVWVSGGKEWGILGRLCLGRYLPGGSSQQSSCWLLTPSVPHVQWEVLENLPVLLEPRAREAPGLEKLGARENRNAEGG